MAELKDLAPRWKYMVRSYVGDELMLETVHATSVGKDMEVRAAENLGRTVVVIERD